MAQISLLQFNHDYSPPDERDACAGFGGQLSYYMRTLDKDELPQGVALVETRHSDDPSIIRKMRTLLVEARKYVDCACIDPRDHAGRLLGQIDALLGKD